MGLWLGEDLCEFVLERSFRGWFTLRKTLALLESRLLFGIYWVGLFLSSPLVIVEEVLNLLHLGLDFLVIRRWGVVALIDSGVSGLLDRIFLLRRCLNFDALRVNIVLAEWSNGPQVGMWDCLLFLYLPFLLFLHIFEGFLLAVEQIQVLPPHIQLNSFLLHLCLDLRIALPQVNSLLLQPAYLEPVLILFFTCKLRIMLPIIALPLHVLLLPPHAPHDFLEKGLPLDKTLNGRGST